MVQISVRQTGMCCLLCKLQLLSVTEIDHAMIVSGDLRAGLQQF